MSDLLQGSLSMWISAALVFVAVALGAVSGSALMEMGRERRRKRSVSEQLQRLLDEPGQQAASGGILRGEAGEGGFLSLLIRRFSHFNNVRILLERGAVEWTVQTYVIRVVGFALAFALAVRITTGSWFFALIGAIAGGVLPYLYVRRRAAKRVERFLIQLPDTIDLLGRAIRAGHPLTSGLRMVADESPEPIGGEFRRVFEEQRFGLPFEDAILGLADRIPLVDLRIFASALLIQREVGGNLAEILDKLSYVIRERFTIKRQINVITAQGRLSGWILCALPIAVGLLLFLINRGYMVPLLTEPMGHMMIGLALFLQFLGFLWIRKIVNIEI